MATFPLPLPEKLGHFFQKLIWCGDFIYIFPFKKQTLIVATNILQLQEFQYKDIKLLYLSKSGCIHCQKSTVVHEYKSTQKYPLPFLAFSENYSIKETFSTVKFKRWWQVEIALVVKCLSMRNVGWDFRSFWKLIKLIFLPILYQLLLQTNFPSIVFFNHT